MSTSLPSVVCVFTNLSLSFRLRCRRQADSTPCHPMVCRPTKISARTLFHFVTLGRVCATTASHPECFKSSCTSSVSLMREHKRARSTSACLTVRLSGATQAPFAWYFAVLQCKFAGRRASSCALDKDHVRRPGNHSRGSKHAKTTWNLKRQFSASFAALEPS